jgi:hypothetical protein
VRREGKTARVRLCPLGYCARIFRNVALEPVPVFFDVGQRVGQPKCLSIGIVLDCVNGLEDFDGDLRNPRIA